MKILISLSSKELIFIRETKWFKFFYESEEFKPGKSNHNLLVEFKSGKFEPFSITVESGGNSTVGRDTVETFANNLPNTVDASYLKSFAKRKGLSVSESRACSQSASAQPLGELKTLLLAQGVVEEVVEALLKAIAGANTTNDTSAKAYANHMLRAYQEYRLEGVVSQVMYLLLNLGKWQGEEARNVKKLLNKWVKKQLKDQS